MNARTWFFATFAAVVLLGAGCAMKDDNAAEKPAMRALGQAAQPEEGGSDEAIGMEIRRRLDLADASATASVIVEVDQGVVTLRGTTATLADAWRAQGVVHGVPGVKNVRNQILVNQ